MTCIGNGPNFTISTITEESSAKMPTFFGYTVYRFPVVLTIFDRWVVARRVAPLLIFSRKLVESLSGAAVAWVYWKTDRS